MTETNNLLKKYEHINVPTGIHIGIRLWFFDLFDIGVVVFSFMIANKVTQAVPMRGFFVIATYALMISLGIFSVIKMPYDPLERNWKNVIYALSYRKKRYWPVDHLPRKEDEDDSSEEQRNPDAW
jgi:hypothetical protein